MLRQMDRALQPLLTNVRVDWGELVPFLQYPSAPAVLPPLYTNGRGVLYAVVAPRLGVPLPAQATVRVIARGPDGELRWPLTVALSDDQPVTALSAMDMVEGLGAMPQTLRCEGRLVHTAAARARLADLERLDGDMGRDEGVALAVQAGVACKWASIVAVESRAAADRMCAVSTTTIGPCGARTISATPATMEGSGAPRAGCAGPRAACAVRSVGFGGCTLKKKASSSADGSDGGALPVAYFTDSGNKCMFEAFAAPLPPAAATPKDVLLKIIKEQTVVGCWRHPAAIRPPADLWARVGLGAGMVFFPCPPYSHSRLCNV